MCALLSFTNFNRRTNMSLVVKSLNNRFTVLYILLNVRGHEANSQHVTRIFLQTACLFIQGFFGIHGSLCKRSKGVHLLRMNAVILCVTNGSFYAHTA